MKTLILVVTLLFLCSLAGILGGIGAGLAPRCIVKDFPLSCVTNTAPQRVRAASTPLAPILQSACIAPKRVQELASAYLLMTIGDDSEIANVVSQTPTCATPQSLIHAACIVSDGGQLGDPGRCIVFEED